MSVSGGCCVVVGGGGGGRGAKPRVGGCALGVGRCVFRGLGQDFAKMVHFRASENLENNFRQHVVPLEYLPTRYCSRCEPQPASCSTSRGASRVMTKCNELKNQTVLHIIATWHHCTVLMYVWSHIYSKESIWINRVRLPVLHVAS